MKEYPTISNQQTYTNVIAFDKLDGSNMFYYTNTSNNRLVES